MFANFYQLSAMIRTGILMLVLDSFSSYKYLQYTFLDIIFTCINMGSKCAVKNDTQFDVWMYNDVNYACFIPVLTGIMVVLTAGAGLAALGAGSAIGGPLLGGGAFIVAEEGIVLGQTAATLAGLTAGQWTVVGIVTASTEYGLAQALGITAEEAGRLQTQVKNFMGRAQKIPPGGQYVWSGSLSLNKRVYVMNDQLQTDNRVCWTAGGANQTNHYTIACNFQALSVKREVTSYVHVK